MKMSRRPFAHDDISLVKGSYLGAHSGIALTFVDPCGEHRRWKDEHVAGIVIQMKKTTESVH